MAQNPNLKTQNAMLEEFHYYPFGMCFDVSKSPMLGKSAAVKYNSQLQDHEEFEDANGNVYGLEDYNFAFRNYDAQIGRWLQPDPLMQHPSPYLAMSNNPVSFTDPTGLWDFDGLDNGDDKPKPPMWESKVGEIRTDGKGNSIIFDGETWRFEREVIANDKNHLMMGSFESTVVNEANLPDNSSGTQVSGVNGKLRRVGDAYNRGHYIENERNWAEGMNAANRSIGRSIWNIFMTGYANGKRPEYIVSVSLADNPLNWLMGGGSIRSLIKAANGGGRAFFSGIGSEARAINKGFQTLGQTRAGKNLQNLIDSKNIPWSQAEPMWQRLSATWAKGVPNGSSVNVFLNNPRAESIWFKTELPILQSKGVRIIYR